MIVTALSVLSGARAIVTSPVSKWIGIGVVAIGAIAYIRHDAAKDARAEARVECREQTAEKTNAELERQARVAKTVLENQYERAAAAEKRAGELQEKADALIVDLRKAGRKCTLGPDTIKRLRELR